MKIAYVLPAISAGGAERVTITLANAFARAGHQVTLFVGFPSPWEAGRRSLIDPAVMVVHIEQRLRSSLVRYPAAIAWLWRRRHDLYSFDVMHCHLTYGAMMATALDLFRRIDGRRTPAIVETYHAVGMHIPALRQWVHAQSLTRRDALVLMAVDPYWTQFTRSHPRLFSRTILNGAFTPDLSQIDEQRRQDYRRAAGVPDDAVFVLGTVGMLRPDRRPELFVPIVRQLVDRFGTGVHWLYAGDGPERPRLEAAVRQAGLERQVHITGVVHDVAEPLSVMDLNFTLTVGDVCGVAAMESALAGVPVVAVQLLPHHVPPASPWIWSSHDRAAVAAHAAALLQDASARARLAARQQEYAREHHSVDRMVAAYESLYRDATVRSGRGAGVVPSLGA